MKNSLFDTKPSASNGGLIYTLAISLYIAFSFVFQYAFGYLRESDLLLFNAISSVVAFLVLFVISLILGFSRETFGGFCNYLKIKRFNPLYLIPVLLLSAGMFFGFGFVNNLFYDLLQSISISIPFASVEVENVTQYIVYTLTLGILPAVSEELFFRGGLLTNCKGLGVVARTVAISLAFALFHGSILQFVYQFIYGLSLAILVEKSGSIFPAVICHFINNFLILTLNFVGVTIDFYCWWIILIGLAVYSIFWVAVILLGKKYQLQAEVTAKEKTYVFYLFASIGILLTLANIVGGFFNA